jgi:hypothetical protein
MGGIVHAGLSPQIPELVDQDVLGEQLLSHRYDALRESLRKDAVTLVSELRPSGIVAALESDEVRTRLLLLSILNKLPVKVISDREWAAKHREFLSWLFLSPDRLGLLLNELRPEDKADKVLEVWAQLWNAEETLENREKYLPLMLALALLYDQPQNVSAPDNGNYPSLSLHERYRYFVTASENHDLETSCAEMHPRELIRVVDLKISQQEIDWSHKNVRESQRNWGSTYGMVEYLMERAVENMEPYGYYVLWEILEKGGVCRDQAYFSAESGKARGIPATYVHGTGDRGAHAWVEFMPGEHEWQSYGSQGIVNGFVNDPQRGITVSSRLMWLESSEDYSQEKRVPVLLVLELAEAARRADQWKTAKTLLEEAKGMASLVVDTWREEVELTKASEGSTEAWEGLLDDMERNYDEHPNILEDIASIRREYLLPTLDDEEMIRALESEIRSMARQNGSEGDLVSEAVASLAKILVERESGEALRSLFKGSLRKYGEDLELFGKLMDSYQRYGGKLAEVKPHIPEDLERYFKREVETGSKEYFRGDMELSIQSRVEDAYRRAGRTEEADDIKEDIAKRRERLERSAL